MDERKLTGIAIFLLLGLTFWSSSRAFLCEQVESSVETLTESEKAALEKESSAEKKLKVYLEVAADRLKQVDTLTRKGDKEGAAKFVKGFRFSLNKADELVAQNRKLDKDAKKQLIALQKATRKFNFSLLQTLEKVPEDCRPLIQSALQISDRVQRAVDAQLSKTDY